jgi:hypothetical protein
MFLKLTDNETLQDIYINTDHVVRFVPDPSSTGTLLFLRQDAGIAPAGEPQVLIVHEHSEEVYRLISRQERAPSGAGGGGRGLI